MNSDDELKKRLEALERENRALKDAMSRGSQSAKTIFYSIGDYKGHPTISFEGACRPFSLGLKKAAVVLVCAEQIREFVVAHKALLDDHKAFRRIGAASELKNSEDSRI